MPTRETTKSQVVRVADLAIASSTVSNRRFEDCLLIGPAVVMFTGEGTLESCTFDGDPESLLWEIPPNREYIIGAIEFLNCDFHSCRFQAIGLAGSKSFMESFTRDVMNSSGREEAQK